MLGSDNSNYFTERIGFAGLAFLAAYRITRTAKYLTSAQACATFLRNCQAIGSHLAANFTSSDAAGTVRLYTGGVVRTIAGGTNLVSNHQFHPQSLSILEFWKALFEVSGDGTYGAPGTVGGVFTSSPAALLSTMMADMRAFWSVGTYDVASGTTYTGLSATTPREFFNAYPAVHTGFIGRDGTGSGSWEFSDADASTGTQITGLNFSAALSALHAYEGYSSQVSSVWTWLMSFTSNAAFQAASGTTLQDFSVVSTNNSVNPAAPPTGQGNAVAPSYDPTLALATVLTVRDSANSYAAIKINGSALYEWAATGIMAAIQSSRNASAFRKAKDTVSEVAFRLPPDFVYGDSGPTVDYATLRGRTGLSFQMDQAGAKLWSCQFAARIGNLYRYQPQSWTGTTQPTNQPGLRV
jgi:hypothetical protein